MTDLSNPIFHDETKARAHLEALCWPDGRYCPHCGEAEKTSPVRGKKHRPGLYYCNSCKKQFTVTVGTVFERSKIPLHKWVLAFHLVASSKKGISAHQLHRMLGVTYKTAWFMMHRIREAMRDDTPIGMGSGGGAVEVDETFIGRNENKKERHRKDGRGPKFKNAVLTLVDRDTGRSRSIVIKDLKAKTIYPIVRANVYRELPILLRQWGLMNWHSLHWIRSGSRLIKGRNQGGTGAEPITEPRRNRGGTGRQKAGRNPLYPHRVPPSY